MSMSYELKQKNVIDICKLQVGIYLQCLSGVYDSSNTLMLTFLHISACASLILKPMSVLTIAITQRINKYLYVNKPVYTDE